MKFTSLIKNLSNLKKLEINAMEAHNLIMNTSVRNSIFNHRFANKKPKLSAVLCLLYPDEQKKTKIVFILRKAYQGHHSGQISFPGGKFEDIDNSLEDTALREANEEINISINEITIIKKLEKVFIPISNYLVQPFLAYTSIKPAFKKDDYEVEKILEFSMSDFVNNELITIEKEYFGKKYKIKAFKNNDIYIWGATAMILSEIVLLFKNIDY